MQDRVHRWRCPSSSFDSESHPHMLGSPPVEFSGTLYVILYVPLGAPSGATCHTVGTSPGEGMTPTSSPAVHGPSMSSYHSWSLFLPTFYDFWPSPLDGVVVGILPYFGCIFTRRDPADHQLRVPMPYNSFI